MDCLLFPTKLRNQSVIKRNSKRMVRVKSWHVAPASRVEIRMAVQGRAGAHVVYTNDAVI